jgi:hypothetical protein
MLAKIKQKVGIILSATILAVMLSAFSTPLVASATACTLNFDNPTEVAKGTKNLSDADLLQCISDAQFASDKCPSSTSDKCQKIIQSLNTLQHEENARLAVDPITKYMQDELTVTDMFELSNRCIVDTDSSVITVIVEEVIESDLVGTNDTKVKNCVRNTFCTLDPEQKKGIECVTVLLNDSIKCSPNARASIKAKTNKDSSLHCQPVQVFISKNGTDLLFLYIGTIYRWAASIVGIIAVLVIVISGIQISAAAGEQQAVTNAKTRIIQSLGGLALLFLSGIILYTINPTFFTAA